jgi:alcohol dehydrogenase class IV
MIYSHAGSLKSIQEILKKKNPKKVLLVTGKSSYINCGAKPEIDSLDTVEIFHFNDFSVNPKIDEAIKGAKIASENEIDFIISIGGGSVLDMAKIIKAIAYQTENAKKIAMGNSRFDKHDIPILSIPTTAGSGSEATHFAVVYVDNIKYSLAHSHLKPDYVILDGKLVLSASKYQKACNVLDVISQAIESAWAVGSTEASLAKSFLALEISIENFTTYVNNESNLRAAHEMLIASNLAGQAIDIAKTTAAHAWSYGLTSDYHVPHGHAVWATLPKIYGIHESGKYLKLNDERGYDHLAKIMKKLSSILKKPKEDTAESFFNDFLESIDIKSNLIDDFKLNKQQRIKLCEGLNVERMANNPVKFTDAQLNEIFYIN